MPRFVRLSLPGHTHHVLQRGNNWQAVFFDDEGRASFLRWLGAAAAAEGCALHAYVLMTNHVHLMLTAERAAAIPRLMQSLGRRYVGYINRAHHRSGTLWEGRYKSAIIDSEAYALACMRYVECNPVRARMMGDPGEYRWSSYRHNAEGAADTLITPHEVYLALGHDVETRRAAYRALFAEATAPDMLDSLRDAIQRGWALGSERFQREIAAALGRPATPPRRGRPPKRRQEGEGGPPATLI